MTERVFELEMLWVGTTTMELDWNKRVIKYRFSSQNVTHTRYLSWNVKNAAS